MMWGYNDGQGWWMVFGIVMMAVFWGGLFVVLYYAFGGGWRSVERPESPRSIAARRLASGEIGDDEFERIVGRIEG